MPLTLPKPRKGCSGYTLVLVALLLLLALGLLLLVAGVLSGQPYVPVPALFA